MLASLVLLVRLAPDVRGKPVFEDEALAGLLAARPLGEALVTAVADRGGAPLHFGLAHVALSIDSSQSALRWLSVLLAVATVPLCYDLGRRLAGPTAGAVAAIAAGTSQMLGVYGSFGRMYALLAFVSALAFDLFVRAVDRPTTATVTCAAAAAWLMPATHPFGLVPMAAEGAVALWLWRGRPLRPALPALVAGVATLPFVFADHRLAQRFDAGVGGNASLVSPGRAAAVAGRALGGFAGGREPLFLLFVALALLGAWALLGTQPAFVALAALAIVGMPAILVLLRSGRSFSDHLASRQFVYALPLWVALVGAGVARAERLLPRWGSALLVAAVAALALAAPSAVPDPRSLESGRPRATAAPADWLATSIRPGDLLFPSSPVFLRALPAARHARALPREQPLLVTRALRRVDLPAGAAFVAVPLDGAVLDEQALSSALGPGFEARRFPLWLLVRARGPLRSERSVLESLVRILDGTRAAVGTPTAQLDGYLRQSRAALCGSLAAYGGRCQ